MGSSAKKKKEKKQDFQKSKLKVGKARPKNTNATDTNFAAKSIVFKQQSLSESGRDAKALFDHNISLLSSKAETQRRDALQYLTSAVQACGTDMPQPASFIVSKAQSLIMDQSSQVRQQLIKLLRVLPASQIGAIDQLLLYTRAGMAHLSEPIRSTSLDILDWLIETNGEAVVTCAGGWVRTLQTFQNLLSWHEAEASVNGKTVPHGPDGTRWSSLKTSSTNMNGNKLLVHQVTSLSRFLHVGLARPDARAEIDEAAARVAETFPLWHFDAHLLPRKSNPFGYLNLFGAPRDLEGEVYEGPDERDEVFVDAGFLSAFRHGAKEARKEAGEIGRAAAAVEKSLRLVDSG